MLEVIEPGLLSTIQDRGRPGLAHLGIRRAGAADPISLAVASLLVGEPADAAAVEMTLLGATLAVRADCLVGIAGADMEARVAEEDRRLAPAGAYRLRAGTTLMFGGAVDGARTYLALAGGIQAERVLGSASTDPTLGAGGLIGRPLRAGDVLVADRPATDDRGERTWPGGLAASGVQVGEGPRRIGVTRGPHADRFGPDGLETIVGTTWRVSPRSDRVGVRLEGPAVTRADASLDELISLPMLPGAVQVPPAGRPIVLGVDAPTVGGYPVAAVVNEADLPAIGQLRPGDEVRFEWLDADTARRRSAAAAAGLVSGARHLGAAP
jgi:5-oxoprolinase (ATP-hydrolysing) subunit C